MDDVGFDGHRFLCCAQRHLEIHAPTVANVQHQALLLGNFESRSLGLNAVVANAQIDRDILARVVSGNRACQTSLRICNRNLNVGHNRSRLVGDGPDDGGILGRCAEWQTGQKHNKNQQIARMVRLC